MVLKAFGDPPPTIRVLPYKSLSVMRFFSARGSLYHVLPLYQQLPKAGNYTAWKTHHRAVCDRKVYRKEIVKWSGNPQNLYFRVCPGPKFNFPNNPMHRHRKNARCGRRIRLSQSVPSFRFWFQCTSFRFQIPSSRSLHNWRKSPRTSIARGTDPYPY